MTGKISTMHEAAAARFAHSHRIDTVDSSNERRTFGVALLTTVTMVVEIVAGYLTGSMALLADGWHMGTHAFALGLSYAAYRLAAKYAESDRFSFGTGKIGILAGYTSALFLGLAAAWMIFESLNRVVNPVRIAFDEAIYVSVVGLAVNLLSVIILHGSNSHHHHDHEPHDHLEEHAHNHHQDPNYQAAYLHVLADALTSVLAIAALLSGRFLGWSFLDPIMGLVGGGLILRWAYSLLKSTGAILLDGGLDERVRRDIRQAVESDGDSRIVDLHAWRIGANELAVIVSVVSGQGRKPEEYRERIEKVLESCHLSVEVHPCEETGCTCSLSGCTAKP